MNRIQVNDYYISIIADSTDTDFLRFLMHSATAKFLVDKQRKANTYHCSLKLLPEVLEYLRPNIPIETMPEIVQSKYAKEMKRRTQTQLLKQLGPDNVHPFLWPHQQLGVELAEVNDRYCFFYDTRTGKTLMSYQIMYNAFCSGAKRAIVICPSAIIQSWKNDAARFPQLKVVAYYGDAKAKEAALRTPSHVVLWSMELFPNSLELLRRLKFDLCFIDESSKLKNYKSKTSIAALEFSGYVPRFYCLSATPAPNGEHEYYTQLKCVDRYSVPDAKTHFDNKYFDDKSYSNVYKKLVVKPNMKEELMSLVETNAIYVDQSVMPTAGKEWHTVLFDMPAGLRATYDDMRKNMATDAAGVVITADMAAAMRGKLSQIAAGFIMDTEAISNNKIAKELKEELQTETYRLSTYRVDELQKLLTSFGDVKVVIWANYKEEFAMIKELLGTSARYLNGDSNITEKEDAIKHFKTGDLQYLICHPASIGMGINLTEAYNVVYYSITDSWELLKQSSERVAGHITVQPNKCHYYVMQASNSVNELMFNNVSHKRDASADFLKHLEATYD